MEWKFANKHEKTLDQWDRLYKALNVFLLLYNLKFYLHKSPLFLPICHKWKLIMILNQIEVTINDLHCQTVLHVRPKIMWPLTPGKCSILVSAWNFYDILRFLPNISRTPTKHSCSAQHYKGALEIIGFKMVKGFSEKGAKHSETIDRLLSTAGI